MERIRIFTELAHARPLKRTLTEPALTDSPLIYSIRLNQLNQQIQVAPMNGHFANLMESGDILVDRHVSGSGCGAGNFRHGHWPLPTSAAAAAGGSSGGNTATATLHSGNWPELARKSCINRLDGNSCWVRYCECDDCRPRVRRNSNASSGSYCDPWEPPTVTDEQLNMSFEVPGLRQNELPIKGTYIDPRIIPGFKYTVRYLDDPEMQLHPQQQRLVYPQPVRLLSIGAGYGKRLTFDTKHLKGKTAGHFWSDNCPEGYALSLAALDVGQRFSLRTRGGQELGRVTVTWTAQEPAECRVKLGADSVTVRVAVAFRANVSLIACRCLLGCHDYEDLPLTGIAWLERPAGSRVVARVTRIEGVRLPDMPDLRLLPLD